MFTLIYKHNLYNFWKSGFLLDFFFKKYIYALLRFFFFNFIVFFSEKYIIEHFFLKINNYLLFLKIYSDIFNKYFISYFLGITFLWTFLVFLLVLNA